MFKINYDILFNLPLDKTIDYLYLTRFSNMKVYHEHRLQAYKQFQIHQYVMKKPVRDVDIFDKIREINPILFVSALSISLIERRDYKDILSDYTTNYSIKNEELELLDLRDIIENDNLLEILKLEKLLVSYLLSFGIFPLAQARQAQKEKSNPSLIDLYMQCWISINVNYLGKYDFDWKRAIHNSQYYSDVVHEERAKWEKKLNQINHLLNKKIANKEYDMVFKKLLDEKQKFTLLVERYRTIYQWMPNELHAFFLENIFTQKFNNEFNKLQPKYIPTLNEFSFPENMLNQLNKIENDIRNKN